MASSDEGKDRPASLKGSVATHTLSPSVRPLLEVPPLGESGVGHDEVPPDTIHPPPRSTTSSPPSEGTALPAESQSQHLILSQRSTKAEVVQNASVRNETTMEKLEALRENMQQLRLRREKPVVERRGLVRKQAYMTDLLLAMAAQAEVTSVKSRETCADIDTHLQHAADTQQHIHHTIGPSQRRVGQVWVAYMDPATEGVYYYNKLTGETTWTQPSAEIDVGNICNLL